MVAGCSAGCAPCLASFQEEADRGRAVGRNATEREFLSASALALAGRGIKTFFRACSTRPARAHHQGSRATHSHRLHAPQTPWTPPSPSPPSSASSSRCSCLPTWRSGGTPTRRPRARAAAAAARATKKLRPRKKCAAKRCAAARCKCSGIRGRSACDKHADAEFFCVHGKLFSPPPPRPSSHTTPPHIFFSHAHPLICHRAEYSVTPPGPSLARACASSMAASVRPAGAPGGEASGVRYAARAGPVHRGRAAKSAAHRAAGSEGRAAEGKWVTRAGRAPGSDGGGGAPGPPLDGDGGPSRRASPARQPQSGATPGGRAAAHSASNRPAAQRGVRVNSLVTATCSRIASGCRATVGVAGGRVPAASAACGVAGAAGASPSPPRPAAASRAGGGRARRAKPARTTAGW